MSKQIFIPYNVPSSKNNKIATKWGVFDSKRVKAYRQKTLIHWLSYGADFKTLVHRLPKPYFIHLTFIRGNRHKFDYINMAQVIKDLMTEHKWIDDDNADEVVTVFGKYSYDKGNPGVIIRVLSKPPQYEFVE